MRGGFLLNSGASAALMASSAQSAKGCSDLGGSGVGGGVREGGVGGAT